MPSKHYNPGDTVNIEDYEYLYDAWLTPDGSMVYVDMCGHATVAYSLFHSSVSTLERVGYVHLSERFFVGGYDRLTEAQVNTIMLYCSAHRRNIPDWCFAYNDAPVHKRDYSMSNKYRTGMGNRKLREMFYPNNGD